MNQIAGTIAPTQSIIGRLGNQSGQQPHHLFDDEEVDDFKVLNAQEAQAVQAKLPKVSLWSALRIQLLAGFMVLAAASFWSGYEGVMICTIAGVMAAWLPSALFVWRMSALQKSQHTANASLMFFFIWEAVKVFCAIALLVIALFYIRPLVWQALLAGFVVTVKAYGVACWLSLHINQKSKELINGC